MKFRWSIAVQQPLLAAHLATNLRISPLLAQCLINRGFNELEPIQNFLSPRLKNLADPFLLPQMREAVDRLFLARERGERVVIFGDYDVDGVTATTLLLEMFARLGLQCDFYLPHRMDEGYGLGKDAAESCLKKFPATLFVAVDCGSTSVEAIRWLKERAVDVIVVDHHQVSDPRPSAFALVNPQTQPPLPPGPPGLPPRPLPFVELCSVGLAFKLAHALVKHAREINMPGAAEIDLRPLLDLVAMGTIADLVPLTGENRILVSAGLERLNATQRPGLVALKQVAQSPAILGGFEVGFQLAPRLNASGRLETAEESLRLLLAKDMGEALPLAQALDARNRERQQIERSIVQEALARLRERHDPEKDYVIVEGQMPWHIGVVGIVASRVLQEFYRPTIILGGDGAVWRGSGRSIAGFDLAAALRECADLLARHGGHAMAAGLSIREENLVAFRQRLNDLARQHLKGTDLSPPLRMDAEVGLDELTLDQMTEFNRLQPGGQGNPAVQFCVRGVTHHRPLQRIGAEKQHVKMWVTDGKSNLEGVWWGAGEKLLPVGTFDLAFAPQINEFNGRRTVQLRILDWR